MSIEAPGLTCATCHGELYPDEARRTNDGWKHSQAARGQCLAVRTAREHARKRQQRLEDLQWMAETGECFSGAAKRLGITFAALDRWLRLNHFADLRQTLLAREPIGSQSRESRRTAA